MSFKPNSAYRNKQKIGNVRMEIVETIAPTDIFEEPANTRSEDSRIENLSKGAKEFFETNSFSQRYHNANFQQKDILIDFCETMVRHMNDRDNVNLFGKFLADLKGDQISENIPFQGGYTHIQPVVKESLQTQIIIDSIACPKYTENTVMYLVEYSNGVKKIPCYLKSYTNDQRFLVAMNQKLKQPFTYAQVYAQLSVPAPCSLKLIFETPTK